MLQSSQSAVHALLEGRNFADDFLSCRLNHLQVVQYSQLIFFPRLQSYENQIQICGFCHIQPGNVFCFILSSDKEEETEGYSAFL